MIRNQRPITRQRPAIEIALEVRWSNLHCNCKQSDTGVSSPLRVTDRWNSPKYPAYTVMFIPLFCQQKSTMYVSVLASANRQCWAQLTAAADEYFTASGVDRLSAKYWVLQARQHPTILTKQQKTPKMTILINWNCTQSLLHSCTLGSHVS
jgi:hypothetical protein